MCVRLNIAKAGIYLFSASKHIISTTYMCAFLSSIRHLIVTTWFDMRNTEIKLLP